MRDPIGRTYVPWYSELAAILTYITCPYIIAERIIYYSLEYMCHRGSDAALAPIPRHAFVLGPLLKIIPSAPIDLKSHILQVHLTAFDTGRAE
jgi:hypothetical protein